jgi:hypothetical protein
MLISSLVYHFLGIFDITISLFENWSQKIVIGVQSTILFMGK